MDPSGIQGLWDPALCSLGGLFFYGDNVVTASTAALGLSQQPQLWQGLCRDVRYLLKAAEGSSGVCEG